MLVREVLLVMGYIDGQRIASQCPSQSQRYLALRLHLFVSHFYSSLLFFHLLWKKENNNSISKAIHSGFTQLRHEIALGQLPPPKCLSGTWLRSCANGSHQQSFETHHGPQAPADMKGNRGEIGWECAREGGRGEKEERRGEAAVPFNFSPIIVLSGLILWLIPVADLIRVEIRIYQSIPISRRSWPLYDHSMKNPAYMTSGNHAMRTEAPTGKIYLVDAVWRKKREEMQDKRKTNTKLRSTKRVQLVARRCASVCIHPSSYPFLFIFISFCFVL